MPTSSRVCSLGTEFVGFYPSCRQAKFEIDEVATTNLRTVSQEIKSVIGAEVHIDQDAQNLEDVVVVISGTTVEDFTVLLQSGEWKRSLLVSLHPLFAHTFNIVRLHLCVNRNMGLDSSPQGGLLARTRLGGEMTSFIRNLGAVVDHANYYHWLTYRSSLQTMRVCSRKSNNVLAACPIMQQHYIPPSESKRRECA